MNRRSRIVLQGVVQGVGYRPFIHRLAIKHGVAGWVMNTTQGLVIEAEGSAESLTAFIKEATTTHPPLAHIERFTITDLPQLGETEFIVRPSEKADDKLVHIPADICVCDDCVAELLNPADRRYRYPFINCVNCGARFTIIRDIPYDRKQTTMQKFQMCSRCEAEYHNLHHRRYHTQPNCCPECGPHYTLLDKTGKKIATSDAIIMTIQRLKQGEIIAVKGIGGFHLVCDATNDTAVRQLRARKKREAKPFAIMSGDIPTIRRYCEISPAEEQLLSSVQRPIVLLRKKKKVNFISEAVAPNNNYFGVMLPYAPLHHLLFQDNNFIALVMTSGNISDEPIVIENKVALKTFVDMVDGYLVHNRDIYHRCDDSIAMVVNRKPIVLRRARGYAPIPIRLATPMPEILGCGAELKNTFCLTKGEFAFISQHIGDLKSAETFVFYQETIARFEKLFRIKPQVIAFDLHPDYLSTQFAVEKIASQTQRMQGVQVQHHHAHIASVIAENQVDEKVIGIAMDGTGYGTDGNIWGCEFLLADEREFDRIAHLEYIPLPGGDVAAAENWRMALSYLYAIYGNDIANLDIPLVKAMDEDKLQLIIRIIEKKINAPLCSSAGRLFDAVSALIGIRLTATYEAQPAIELEMAVDENVPEQYSYRINEQENQLMISCRPMFEEIVTELKQRVPTSVIAAKFHNTVVAFAVDIAQRIRNQTGLNSVALSGGTFQNRIIVSRLIERLQELKFKVYTHQQMPPNDACVSFGQVVVANAQINQERTKEGENERTIRMF
ncbi:MAG: carbamoyltransferase HypF [bacterium]|nr:carbamoyltransferase HypF [bacterium]